VERGYALIMNDRGVGNSERPNGAEPDVDGIDRRSSPRVDVLWSVDCETEETFLYASITNISEMGIFVQTNEPLAVGTAVILRFAPGHGCEPFILNGVVQWVNRSRPQQHSPNPGMGIRFASLTLPDRERIVASIRTIAYLREEPRATTAERN
jgi:type IV pilus assembly protein PilZ